MQHLPVSTGEKQCPCSNERTNEFGPGSARPRGTAPDFGTMIRLLRRCHVRPRSCKIRILEDHVGKPESLRRALSPDRGGNGGIVHPCRHAALLAGLDFSCLLLRPGAGDQPLSDGEGSEASGATDARRTCRREADRAEDHHVDRVGWFPCTSRRSRARSSFWLVA